MEENFTPQQSLMLIQTMIDKTKGNLSRNRFYFLLWGWYTFIAIITQFILKVVLHYERHYLVWLGVIPAVIGTVIYTFKQNKRRTVRTYVGESMASLWTGVGVSFFVLSFIISSSKEGWMFSYPFFILLYGLGTFISGRILKFTPLVVGGVINWVLACLAGYVHYDYQMLLAAIAILTSYIIPGHLLGLKRN
jgi:hypothetical protein